MSIECIAIIGAIATVLAGLGGAWIGGIISRKASREAVKSSNQNAINIMKRQEYFIAASKFKSSILYELIGFYPIDQYWNKDHFSGLYDSIPKINTIAAEFRYFVTSKDGFDNVVNKYNKYCRETTYDNVSSNRMYPDMREKGQKSKFDEFKNIVEHLLSFAGEG